MENSLSFYFNSFQVDQQKESHSKINFMCQVLLNHSHSLNHTPKHNQNFEIALLSFPQDLLPQIFPFQVDLFFVVLFILVFMEILHHHNILYFLSIVFFFHFLTHDNNFLTRSILNSLFIADIQAFFLQVLFLFHKCSTYHLSPIYYYYFYEIFQLFYFNFGCLF